MIDISLKILNPFRSQFRSLKSKTLIKLGTKLDLHVYLDSTLLKFRVSLEVKNCAREKHSTANLHLGILGYCVDLDLTSLAH